jgi:streptogramin lyase/two-component sensor histidine kinase
MTTEMIVGPDLGGARAAAASPIRACSGARRDVHGSLWIATYDGLLRFQSGRMERFTREDGLSGNGAYALFEDREGDLWLATTAGIDRFRDPTAVHLSMLDGLRSDTTHSLIQTPDGAVWVGSGSANLDRIADGRITHVTFADSPRDTAAVGLYVDHTGKLWVGTSYGVFHESGNGFHEVTAPDGSRLKNVRSISGDRGDNIWVIDQMFGLLQVHGATTSPVPSSQMPLPFRVATGSDGTLWAASYKTGLLALRKSGVTPTVLHDGPTQFIYEDQAGETWVGMGSSLSRLRRGRWTTWDAAQGLTGKFLYGLAEDDCGGFWILTEKALLRLDAAELRGAADGAPGPLGVTSYGLADGLHLTMRGLPSPRIIRAADGRIWFCESTGVGIIDPETLRRNEVPPPVHIELMTWNGHPVSGISGNPSFQAGEVHISYTGISLAAPDLVRFKYRLEPQGHWIDAGARRDVTYAGLAPGRYRFRVAACNRHGVWNEAGAAIDFRMEPYFYQTPWFFAACAGVIAFAIYGAYLLRVRRLTRHFALVAQERARVTREIHDSLLQGFTGVVYQLDAAARQFDTDPAQCKLKLESALDRADEALREAREVLSTMRLPALETHTLPEALAETGAKLTENTAASFHGEVAGPVEPLRYEVQANLFLIGREAIANAVSHSGASHIRLLLVYGDKELQLSIQDDGKGFDSGTVVDREGHWGLRNMQERARQIHAEFVLKTAPGDGTRIEVRVRRKHAQTT